MAAYLPSFVQAPDFMDETEAQGGKSKLPGSHRVLVGSAWPPSPRLVPSFQHFLSPAVCRALCELFREGRVVRYNSHPA